MSLVFTMPGKLGDALLQWPVANRYCVESDQKCVLWMDEKTCAPLVDLFASQPCVEAVELRAGIKSYECGGQPWDFGLSTQDHLDHDIVHLGLRQFPTRQITLETLETVPLRIRDRESLSQKPSLVVTPNPMGNSTLVLHGPFTNHTRAVPSVWRFLADHMDELREMYDVMVFVGTDAEVDRAVEVYPHANGFKDGGNLLKTAELMAGAKLVIGAGSSMVALAGALKVPSIRVHDAIGEHPRVLWSNLGPQQWNETELTLRKMWPEIRQELANERHAGIAG